MSRTNGIELSEWTTVQHGKEMGLETLLADTGGGDPENRFVRHRMEWIRALFLESSRTLLHEALDRILEALRSGNLASDAYSISSRLVLLTQVIHGKGLDRHRDQWHPILHRGLEDLARDLEYHGSLTNNHLLNNARALVVGGCALGARWAIEGGMRILEDQLPRRLDHGMLNEGSVHYQFVVLRWMMDVWLALQAGDVQRSTRFKTEIIDPMLQSAVRLVDPAGGFIPLMGDVSPDWPPSDLLPLPHAEGSHGALWAFYEELAPDAMQDLFLAWHSAREAAGAQANIEVKQGGSPDPECQRGPARVLTNSDAAWMSYPALNHRVHGHLDAGHVVLCVNGEGVLLDAGRPGYRSLEALRPARHNAPSIDARFPVLVPVDRFKRFGSSGLWQGLQPSVPPTGPGGLGLAWSPNAGVRVQRMVSPTEGGWTLVDEASGPSRHIYRSSWLLPESARIAPGTPGTMILIDGLSLVVEGVDASGIRLDDDTVSTAYGIVRPARRLDLVHSFDRTFRMALTIRSGRNGHD